MKCSDTLNTMLVAAALLIAGAAPRAETVTLPLRALTAAPGLELRCVSGGQSISLPIPERWHITKATLSLHYTASNNMIGDLSQLVVKLNGDIVTQMRLDNQAPGVTADVDLPADRLRAGYNPVVFQVTQHYLRSQCEQPCAPDLWTNISLTDSAVKIDYDLKPVPLRLGEAANWVFDPKLTPEGHINLVTDVAKPEATSMAAVVASGIARRFDYRKVLFTHSTDFVQGVDNVLVGSEAFVGPLLTRYGIPNDIHDAGLISVHYLPKQDGGNDGLHALIVVTGGQAAGLKVATETFANMSLPYPGSATLQAYAFTMPDISMYSGREELIPGKLYNFATLGLESSTFQGFSGKPTHRGYNANASELSFRLPPDFLIKQNQYARLVLNLSYGAGLREDSTLTLSLNDKQVRDIHLNSPDGNYIEGYRIDVPTYLFKPGTNVISFRPYMNTKREVCDVSNTDGLFVTIFGNSTLTFPMMPHFVDMPRLELFTLNGFPFTRWPDGYETLVYLPQPSKASIDAAFDLVGMITQKNGFPMFGAKIVYSEPTNWVGDMLVVGVTSSVPRPLLARGPFQPEGVATVSYPVSRGWDTETSIVQSRQLGGLGEGMGLVSEFESPNQHGRSVVLVTASGERDLLSVTDALLSPAVQARVAGDVALVKLDVPDYDVTTMTVGNRYSVGDKGGVSAFDAFLYAHLNLLYGLIALLIVVTGLVAYVLTKRYRAKRVAGKSA